MSELIVTDEERAASSYLEWDDASLGRFTKEVALRLEAMRNDAEGLHRVTVVSAAMLLVGGCLDSNAGELVLTIGDFEHIGKPEGDWIITVKRAQ